MLNCKYCGKILDRTNLWGRGIFCNQSCSSKFMRKKMCDKKIICDKCQKYIIESRFNNHYKNCDQLAVNYNFLYNNYEKVKNMSKYEKEIEFNKILPKFKNLILSNKLNIKELPDINGISHYVYIIMSIETPYFYIGKRSIKYVQNDDYLGSGNKLHYLFRKVGKGKFYKKILSFHNSIEEALLEEAKLVTKEDLDSPYLLNIKDGGKGCRNIINTIKKNDLERYNKIQKHNSEQHKGRISINKNFKMKRIKKEELQKYLNNNWQLGPYITDKTKRKVGELTRQRFKNKTYIQYQELKISIRIDIKLIDSYYDQGWIIGRYLENNLLENMNNKIKADHKNRKWINKDCKNKWVKEQELQKYLDNEWQLGQYVSEEAHKNRSNKTRESLTNIVHIKRENETKKVKKQYLDYYLKEGWIINDQFYKLKNPQINED